MHIAGISVENTEREEATPKDVTALLTPPLEDNTTHHSNGRLDPQSPTQIPPSSPPTSPASDPPSFSDRHGYRFRCSRCSLAFPTQEKLQLHWQYHAMRAATECPICSRQCRSQEALQRHMQNSHSQLDNIQGQNTLLPPHTTQLTELNKSSSQQDLSFSPQVGQEAGVAEDGDLEEEEMFDVDEKEDTKVDDFKEKDMIGENDGSEEETTEQDKGPHEEIVSEPSSSSPIKKSSNPTMDRYLDPTRPYKCTICSESFTQKTILLVHYNSVSHLHRARRALQDSGPGVAAPEAPRGQDSRPFRCRLCGVGYSQSSTLDIHLRSVLHQTRARAAQNSAPQTVAPNAAATVSVSTTVTQAPSTREEKTSKNLPSAKRPDVASCSTSSLPAPGLPAEAQSVLSNPSDNQQAKKRVAELLASRNQLMLIQQQQMAQAQAQAQLQQQTALLQSQLMQHLPLGPESLLKQHFPLTPENLLTLQQQLLLPFYLSGDMTLSPELAVKSLEQSVLDISILKEQAETEPKRGSQAKINEKQQQKQDSIPAFTQLQDGGHGEAAAEGCSGSSTNQTVRQLSNSKLEEEKEEKPVPTVKSENQKNDTDPSSCNPGLQCPPPRVPYAAVNGEPVRSLLQSYGFELALQYIQSRQRHQQQISTLVVPDELENSGKNEMDMFSEEKNEKSSGFQNTQMEGFNDDKSSGEVNGGVEDLPQEKWQNKEEENTAEKEKTCCERGEKCRECGKFFSDALILKSHQEYIHRSLFPTAALERFSREYRLQYDQMYPLPQPKSGEDLTTCPQAAVPAPSSDQPEPKVEQVKPQIKTPAPSPDPSVSDALTKACTPVTEPALDAPQPSPPLPSQPQDFSQEVLTPSTSTTAPSHTTSQATSIPLPLPMLPLTLPQLPMPPLALPKLSLPPIPFPMELPLLPPVVMQSVALQSKPWLDSSVNPELAKLYQSQLNQALLGQQPQLSPALLSQQPQLSPALQVQSPQLNPVLLGQPPQPNPIQTGQQSQVSPSILEHGKRTRTRISEEQLTVLRKHFDINSLPSDEEINKMSALSGLPHKVIKHWFRNTLFKERQRDKDSPYNFNNPPTISLEVPNKEIAQPQPLSLSPNSLSPCLPANNAPQPKATDLQRGESHRGRRSSRTRFTEQQLETLQCVFEATPYPREEEYDRLSAKLSLPNRVIVVWFQNARQRARKNQDRGIDDGPEGKNQRDSIHRQKNGFRKDDDDDNDNYSFGDDGQGESQNENSMDLTYEYYTHPDSPFLDSSSPCPESEHLTAKGESTPVTRKQEDNTALVQTQGGVSNADIEHKDTVLAMKTGSSPKSEPNPQLENTQERPAPCYSSSSLKAEPTIISTSHSSQGLIHSPHSGQAVEKSSETPPSLPAPPEPEKSHFQQPDANSGLAMEAQSSKQPPPQTQAQFQCSLCPVSLPSFQLWQEHQTRHLLAAQSHVQFLHSGFTDRTMPYMMLHPNHTLMASQMLSGAMSQMHPNPSHAMLSHLNSIQMKNTHPDHSSTPLTSLTQNPLATIKQNSKLLSESSLEGQRNSRDIEEDHRRDKRQRTTITPEQLEVLYQRYSLDSNPTRGVLESIARDVGLTRRVVQVFCGHLLSLLF